MSRRLSASLALLLALLALVAPVTNGNPPRKDYYEILGVKPSATKEEIQRAFFSHSAAEALKVLSDPAARLEYDHKNGHIHFGTYFIGTFFHDFDMGTNIAGVLILLITFACLLFALECARRVCLVVYWLLGPREGMTHKAWLRRCVVIWAGPLLTCLAMCYAPPVSGGGLQVTLPHKQSQLNMSGLRLPPGFDAGNVTSCVEWEDVFPEELSAEELRPNDWHQRSVSVVLCSDARSVNRHWFMSVLEILAMRWIGAVSHKFLVAWIYHRAVKLWSWLTDASVDKETGKKLWDSNGMFILFFIFFNSLFWAFIFSRSLSLFFSHSYHIMMWYWSVVVRLFYQFVARTVGSALWCPAPGRHPTLDWTALGTTTNEWMCPFGPDDYNRFHLDWPRTVWNKFPFLGRRVA